METRRVRRGLRLAAAGAVSLLVASCSAAADPPHYPESTWSTGLGGSTLPVSRPTGAPACSPQIAPTTVAEYDRWMSGIAGLPTWQSADVGLSARLVDGRVAWVFGDTARAADVAPRFASSSMLITEGDCTAQPVDHGQPLLPNRAGSACWPSSMVSRATAAGDDLWIACSRVRRHGSGLYDFDYLGASVATLHIPRRGAPTAPVMHVLTRDDTDQTQPNWGASMVLGGDGYLYVYGSVGLGVAGPRALLLARVTPEQAADRARWSYWSAAGWSTDQAAATPVVPADPGVSQAATVHRIAGAYVLVSKKGGDLRDELGVWTATAPQGPWTLVHQESLPHDAGNGVVTYQPLAHPELPLADGGLLVSYSRNPNAQDRLLRDPSLGRPGFLEVPMP